MTKQEARTSIAMLSCGTIGTLTGLKRYDDIDNHVVKVLDQIDNADEHSIEQCECWQDVWSLFH